MALETPILFIIFNRPENTQRVFDAIRAAQPKQLFVTADGARSHKPEDADKVAKTRAVIDQVDWPCEVKTLFRDENVGCKNGPYLGMRWFFEHVDQGIILEDDCLPVPAFFTFCESMLNKYKHDTRVMQICGNSFLEQNFGDGDYFFSVIPHIWGWATWKRAYDMIDINMERWPAFKNANYLEQVFSEKRYSRQWTKYFEQTYSGKLNDVWDWQWVFTVMSNYGLSITPNHNLITNIGFTSEGTHTLEENHLSNVPAVDIPIVKDPTFVFPSKEAIKPIMEHVFLVWEPPLHRKIINETKVFFFPNRYKRD